MGNYQYFIFLLFPPRVFTAARYGFQKIKAENLSIQTERAQPRCKPDDTMEGLQHSSENLRVDEAFHVPRPVCVPSLFVMHVPHVGRGVREATRLLSPLMGTR